MWGWKNISCADILIKIHGKLKNFETMYWYEIEKNNMNHFMPIDKLTKQAQNRLKELNIEDTDEMYSLHLGGKERIWGMRENEILKILWWDPDHTVYIVPKKHT